MSTPETPQLLSKPEVKQRRSIPCKPSNNTPDTSSVDPTASQNSGNVKKIVYKFSQPESKIPCGGTAAPKTTSLDRKPQETPSIKPRRKVKKPSAGKEPLLPKTKPNHSGEKEEAEGSKASVVTQQEGSAAGINNGGRSAPDGKETGKPRTEQDSSPLPEPQCERNCSCVCHLQRPGMKLVWVPISEKEEDEDETDAINLNLEIETNEMENQNENEEKGESEEQDKLNVEAETLSESVAKAENQSKAPLTNKKKFQETRNLIEQQLRRKSDPGPPSVLSLVPFPQTPLNAPKAQSLDDQEESIYELSLEVIIPPRLQKGSDTVTSKDTPPAIPPRIPLDNRRSPRLVLPQPVARPTSPLMPPTKCSPPASPRPHKAPPPPPTKSHENGRRPSSYSLKSIDENDDEGADGDKCGSSEKPSRLFPRRQHSIDLEAGMSEEYLYQFYTKTFISREIRKTVCRNISKTSIDFQMDQNNAATLEKGAEGLRSSPVPAVRQNNLWRDQPAVQEKGLLQILSPEECKYQESMFELITSEMSYLRSLRVLTEHFMVSSDLSDILIIRDKKTLFSNIQRIQEVSERFLKDLQERLDENVVISDVCDIIHYHAQHHFPAYIDYVRNQIYQEKTFTNLMQTNTQFATVITRLQESPRCQRLPLMSFLLLPFQRITRIKMLIENILKKTAVGTDKEQTASKALDSVSKIIEECNSEVGKMRQMEELIAINGMLEFDKLKAVPIISQTRYLEKRGELQEVNRGGGAFLTLRPKVTTVYLFLFNDLLIITTKKSSERYVVLDHAHRSLIQVESLEEDPSVPSLENCLCLTLLENHQGRQMERVLKAPTQSDLHRWLAVFPNPNDPNKDQDEVVYEDWDCPQVQCVEQYVANQADELNLEPTEIVNISRKTNEGWYEGVRLSDGQKGWFPVANVLEITNEHVRRRNIKERYRVIQAAGAVANKTRSMP